MSKVNKNKRNLFKELKEGTGAINKKSTKTFAASTNMSDFGPITSIEFLSEEGPKTFSASPVIGDKHPRLSDVSSFLEYKKEVSKTKAPKAEKVFLDKAFIYKEKLLTITGFSSEGYVLQDRDGNVYTATILLSLDGVKQV